jgi:formylglycine-generating enzyme required for sulfatase activity
MLCGHWRFQEDMKMDCYRHRKLVGCLRASAWLLVIFLAWGAPVPSGPGGVAWGAARSESQETGDVVVNCSEAEVVKVILIKATRRDVLEGRASPKDSPYNKECSPEKKETIVPLDENHRDLQFSAFVLVQNREAVLVPVNKEEAILRQYQGRVIFPGVPAGRYSLIARRKDYKDRPYWEEIVVQPQQTSTFSVPPFEGTLKVHSVPSDCDICPNGGPFGQDTKRVEKGAEDPVDERFRVGEYTVYFQHGDKSVPTAKDLVPYFRPGGKGVLTGLPISIYCGFTVQMDVDFVEGKARVVYDEYANYRSRFERASALKASAEKELASLQGTMSLAAPQVTAWVRGLQAAQEGMERAGSLREDYLDIYETTELLQHATEVHQSLWDLWPKEYHTVTLDPAQGVTMTFVKIPAGTFMMGTCEEDIQRYKGFSGRKECPGPLEGAYVTSALNRQNEGPQCEVKVSKPFYISVTEVTRQQWATVMHTAPWAAYRDPWALPHITVKGYPEPVQVGSSGEPSFEGPSAPANHISYPAAHGFCKALSEGFGCVCRLPTEAEWEYAARGGSAGAYCCGNERSRLAPFLHLRGGKMVGALGALPGNAWGVKEMHCGVCEWTGDLYAAQHPAGPVVDPGRSDPAGDAGLRVIKGGCLASEIENRRCAWRVGADGVNTFTSPYVGVRVLVEELPKEPVFHPKTLSQPPEPQGPQKPPPVKPRLR